MSYVLWGVLAGLLVWNVYRVVKVIRRGGWDA